MKLFLATHDDDAELWGAFTILRERPEVCVLFDSYIQSARGAIGCEMETRRKESAAAAAELLGADAVVIRGGLCDDREYTPAEIADHISFMGPFAEHVWAPAFEQDGHSQHNAVALGADIAFPGKVTHYLSYTRNGGKSRNGIEVQPQSGDDIARKLRALACHTSQLQMDPRLGCWPHFMNDLREYVQ